MNSKKFVDVIKLVVRDAAIMDVIAISENPSGRRVSEMQKSRAEWLRSLNGNEREIIKSLVTDAVDQTLFGFLCVLDGVRAVENGPAKGAFELRYLKGESVLLNPQDESMLHDLYNSITRKVE